MNLKSDILLISDSITHDICTTITGYFNTAFTNFGQRFLGQLIEYQPNLAILFSDTSAQTLLDAAQTIRQNPSTQSVCILMISPSDDPDIRIQAYQSGADEYLHLPIASDDLFLKIRHCLNEHHKREQAHQPQPTERSSSELGVVSQYLQAISHCTNIQALERALFGLTSAFELKASVHIQTNFDELTSTCDGEINPLEAEAIIRMLGQQSVFEIGARSFFNSAHLSLLIKNMPVRNKAFYSRLKDHLSIAVRNAESRVAAIEVTHQLDHQHELETLLDTAKEQLEQALSLCTEYEHNTQKIHHNLSLDMSACLTGLGISSEQTQMIMSLCHAAQQQQANLPQSAEITQSLHHLITLTVGALAHQRSDDAVQQASS